MDLPGAGPESFLSTRKAHIQVNESFGGLAPDVHAIDVLTGSGGGIAAFHSKLVTYGLSPRLSEMTG
jgi:hypothetical protein